MKNKENLLNELQTAKHSRGKNLFIKFLTGERLTARQAILAKCCDCMCYYEDGMRDCEVFTCPLHSYMPYTLKSMESRRKYSRNKDALLHDIKTHTVEDLNQK